MDFKLLATKVQKDYQIKSKNLKENNQGLDTCKKEYQKLYHENETLKKRLPNNKRNFSNVEISLNVKLCLGLKKGRKINLNDIEFEKNKFKKLFAARKKKRPYYDYYSYDNDNKSADDESEVSDVEESNEDEEIIVKKKNIKKKNKTKTKPPPTKQKKKHQKGILDYINS